MRITSLEIQNFRSFERMGPIEFDQINVFVGPNNAGKSSLIRAIHLLQKGCEFQRSDVRVGKDLAQVVVGLEDIQGLAA